MMKRTLCTTMVLAMAAAAPLAAQQQPAPRISVEPYIGYNFFGSLPTSEFSAELDGSVAMGARAAYQVTPQWAVFGNFQRSNPTVTPGAGAGPLPAESDIRVDQWATGVEFSYVPRGGAEGMLPIQMEAGLAQTRYTDWGINDLGVKIGVSSALQLSRNFAVRYGVDDYITNFDGNQGVVNQFTARIGGEIRF